MKAMILNRVVDLGQETDPLTLVEMEQPVPNPGEILIEVKACGVCHTELDEIEGRTPPPSYPIVPGHQAVGAVTEVGVGVTGRTVGDRVGVAWIFSTCGSCSFCSAGLENLCRDFKATGRDANGGYAQYMTVSETFAHLIPDCFSDIEAAPLLCAGAIGYRSLNLCNFIDGQVLGLSGFGASAHLVLKLSQKLYPRSKVLVFARNEKERNFAMELGAHWSGDFGDIPPLKPRAIIDTTPAWKPVLDSLAILEAGGRLVINAIRKEERDKHLLSELDYIRHLWMEKEIKSVANVSSNDVREFLQVAAEIPIRPEVQTYSLEEANRALVDLKTKKIRGAKVLAVSS